MMEKRILFLWLCLCVFIECLLVVGGFCLFFNYFFVSLFSLKNCIGISFLFSLCFILFNYNYIKCKINKRFEKK